MKITKTSMASGLEHTLEIDVTQDQLDRWQKGELIQNVMPNLTPDEREFLMTGITAGEFKSVFDEEYWEEEYPTDDGQLWDEM